MATEDQIKDLVGLEDVLCCLDQHAGNATNVGRACLKTYAAFDKLREREIAEWNATETEQIHRCTEASLPYHTTDDGPCEVYTTDGMRWCALHRDAQADREAKVRAERAEYFAAKRRGEDV